MPLWIRSNSQLDFDGLALEVGVGRGEGGMRDMTLEPRVGRRWWWVGCRGIEDSRGRGSSERC